MENKEIKILEKVFPYATEEEITKGTDTPFAKFRLASQDIINQGMHMPEDQGDACQDLECTCINH